MADPTNAKIRDGVQKPVANIDGNELVELDDTSIGTGDPDFYMSSLSNLDTWFNARWYNQEAPSGFLKLIDEISTITFNDGTKTLTITPTSSTFTVYVSGKKIVKTGAQQVVIADTEGLHWIYYDPNGNLVDFPNPSISWAMVILRKYAIVAYVHWDKVHQKSTYFTGKHELHGMNFPGTVHGNLHFTQGTKYLDGCEITDVQSDQSGDLDSHAQFGMDAGQILDEDLFLSLLTVISTVGLPVFYLDGADGDLRMALNSGFSVLTTGAERVAWNEWTGSTWQMTEVANNKFVNYFVLAYNDKNYGYCSFMGQAEYNSKKDAQDAATTEVYTIVKSHFPVAEALACYAVTFQSSSSYGNTVKARVVGTPIDLRKSNLNLAVALTLNHNTLTGLELAAPTGVDWGHVDDYLYSQFINPLQKNTYYFGYHGDDTNDGTSIDRAVQDVQVAINLAQALTPAVDKRFSIVCMDAYQHSSPSNLYSWIDLFAPEARFRGGAINVADDCNVNLYHFDNEGTIGRVILKSGTGTSFINIPFLEGRIEVDAGTLYVKANQWIAPSTTDEYIDVNAGTTLYVDAKKYKGKITVESTGTLYINLDDSSEITENFAVGAIVHKRYKDQMNPRQSLTTGTFNVEPWHENYYFNNKAASNEVFFDLPQADSSMFKRGTFYFYVSDSGTYYLNIRAHSGDSIRVGDVSDTRLRAIDNGNLVGLHVVNNTEWSVETIVGTWILDTA